MQLNDLGKIIDEEIIKIESHYTNVLIDKYKIMPNHIHMLIAIMQTERINPFPTIKYDIPNIIGKFKAGVTRRAVGDCIYASRTCPSQKHLATLFSRPYYP